MQLRVVVNPPARIQHPGMTMDLRKYVGHRVRLARKQRGMTQEQLAEAVGKAVETISNIERGHAHTGLETLERLAGVLETPIRDFFEEAGEDRDVSRERLGLEDRLRGLSRDLTDGELRVSVDQAESLVRHRSG